MLHQHVEQPFLCIKSTMMGWAVSSTCDPELIELCSEMIVGDVSFLSDLNAMFGELRRRGASTLAIETLRRQLKPQPV